jgi:hypothetical protein
MARRPLFVFYFTKKDKRRGKERFAMSLLIADKGAAREGVRRKVRSLYMRLREGGERDERKEYVRF